MVCEFVVWLGFLRLVLVFFFPRGKAHTFFLSDCLISQRHFSQDFTDLIPVVEAKDFKIVSDALFSSFGKYPPVLL